MGSFAVHYSFFDVGSCIGFGIAGWLLKKYGFPVVLGMVLGKLAESNFRRAVIMGGYGMFFSRPASLILLLVALLSFAYPMYQTAKARRESRKEA